MSGAAAPTKTGTSTSQISAVKRAFRVACSMPTLPATVVRASTRTSGAESAMMMATASSVSVSMRKLRIGFGSLEPLVRYFETQRWRSARQHEGGFLWFRRLSLILRSLRSGRLEGSLILRSPRSGRLEGRHALKSALQVGLRSLDVLVADAGGDGRAARRPAGRGAVGCAVEGNRQTFVAAPGSAEAEELEPVEEGRDRRLRDRREDDAEEAGRAGEIALPDRVAGVVGQGRVDHPQNLGPRLKPARQRQPLPLGFAQPQVHRAEPAQREKDVLRPGRDPHQACRLMEPLEPRL